MNSSSGPVEPVIENVGAVVVHYHREDVLEETVRGIMAQGISPQRVVVVSNGGNPDQLERIARAMPEVAWLDLPNPGYAAAVNAGMLALPVEVELVLIATHEVSPKADAISRMVSALCDRSISIAGPILTDSRTGELWSAGGRLSWLRGIPFNSRSSPGFGDGEVSDTAWLDGACMMVRRSDHDLVGGMIEDYFLYFEDVDYALRLRRELRRRAVVVRGAYASQSPGGALDTYLATRNLLVLLRTQGPRRAYWLFQFENRLRVLLGEWFGRGEHRARQSNRRRALTDARTISDRLLERGRDPEGARL